MRRLRNLVVVSITCSLIAITSCSKSDSSGTSSSGASSSSSILDSQVLSYIPASSVGFFTWDTQSESYKRLKASALGAQMSRTYELLKKAEDQAPPESKKAFKIIDGLVQTGLWTKSPSQPEAIKNAVMFFDIDTAKKLPQAAFYGNAADGANLQEKITAMEGIINAEGIKTAKETVGENKGFSIEIEGAKASGSPIDKLFVLANKDKVAIATTTDLASKFFNAQGENGIKTIKDSNEFKKATSGIASTSDSMTFAYFDVNKLVGSLETVATATGIDTGSKELKEIPVDAVAASSSMQDSLTNSLSVALNPKNDSQKSIITALNGVSNGGGQNDAFKKVPSDIMILLSIDGSAIKGLKGAALASAPPGAVDGMQPIFDLVDSVKSIAIGLRGATGAAPFPELVLLAESPKAVEIQTTIKAQLEGALAASGMPLPWQEKTVNDAKVTYAMSPFGVGAYLTNANEVVILGSTEKLVGDVVVLSKDKSTGLASNLPKNSKSLVNDNKSLLVAYSDFSKVGNALGAAQDSLAMFTGGQGSLPPDQIENIKQIGTVLFSLNLDNNIVKMQSTYEPAPAPKNG